MKLKICAISLLGALALSSGPAFADIIFQLGNNPQSDEQNIFFNAPESGTTITGEVGNTGIDVLFSSTQTLFQRAQGQADIFGSPSNPNNTLLTNIAIDVPGYTFQDFILNLQNGTGSAVVTAVDNFNQTFTYTLGNGQNFLTIFALPGSGQSIEGITVSMLNGVGGFEEFKQPRISGVAPNNTSLPEPGSLLLLASVLGVIGVMARHRSAE
jgi:hypothetical protein